MANPNPFLTSPSDDRADLYKLPDLPQSKAADSSRFEPVDPSEITAPARGSAPTRADVIRRAVELDVDPRLALSIWSQESTSGANTKTSSKGARGGFQVMPGTYTSMMKTSDGQDDPWNNMEAGLRYIAYGQKTLGTRDPALLAAGYHAGYERDSLKRGEIPNVSDGKKNTRDYAREVAGRVGGADAKAPDVTEGGRFEPVSAEDALKSVADDSRFEALNDADLEKLGLKQPDGGGFMGTVTDIGKNLKVGADIAAQDARELVGRIPVIGRPIVKGADAVDRYFHPEVKDSADLLNKDTQQVTQSMTPAMQSALQKKWWDSDKGTFGPAWSDWRSYAGGVAQSLPEQGVTMLPAMQLAKGVFAAKLAAGATEAAAGASAATAAQIAGSLSEGLLGGAQSSREVRQKVQELPQEVLDQSDAYKSLLSSGLSPSAAREALSNDLATRAFVTSGLVTGAFGGMGDRAIAKVFTEQVGKRTVLNTLGAFGKGALGEGLLEELPQSVGQQLAQNEAIKKANPKQDIMEDVVNQGLGGMALGAAQGGGMAGLAHGRGHTEVPKDEQPAPAAQTGTSAQPQPAQPAPAPGPSTAPGPMTRAAENAADKHAADNGTPRVTVTAPNGEAVQGEMHAYQETPDGGFTATLVDDDGNVVRLSDKDGVSIVPQEHEAGPLTGAAHAVAETQPAPVAQPEAQAEPAATAEQPAAEATVQPPVKEPAKARPKVEADLTAMSMEELRARLKYVAGQAKDSGWNTMLMAERKRVEREINKRADEQARAQQAEAQTALPLDGTYADRADANAAMLKAAEATGKPHEVVEQGGKFTIKPIHEDTHAPANDARVDPVSAPTAQPTQPANPAESGFGGAAAGKPAAVEPPALSKEAAPAKVPASVQSKKQARLQDHFTPGNIIENDGGQNHDRVISFDWNGGKWSAQLQRVQMDANGKYRPNGPVRSESIAPTKKNAVILRGEEINTQDSSEAPNDAHAGKWFGSQEKADAYLAKKKIGDTHQVEQTGKVRFEIKPKQVATQAAEVATEVPANANVKPNEFIEVKDSYGRKHIVRQLDLDGQRTRIPTFTKNGEKKDAIHRDNIDLTGEKKAALDAATASNAMFDVITADGSKTFKTEAAAKSFATKNGYSDTHEVAPASNVQDGLRGFVLKRKEQPNAGAVQPEQEKPAVPAAADGKPVAADVERQPERSSTPDAPTQGEVNGNQEARTENPGQVANADVKASHADTANGEKGNAANAADEKGQQPGPIEKRRGEVGGKLASGEVVLTASGRETSPFPKIKTDTNRKSINTLKAVDQWLMQNASDEARSRGDEFNARQFEANLSRPSQADKDSAEEYLFGQQPEVAKSILKPLVPASEKPQSSAEKNAIFSQNKLFTADAVEKARARLRSKMTQLNSGIDPEIMMDGIVISGAYIEAGVRKFADFAKAMVDDLGPKITPFILSFYEGARHYPGLDTEGMTGPAAAKKAHDAMLADMSNEQNSPTMEAEASQNDTQPTQKDAGTGAEGQAAEPVRADEGGRNAGRDAEPRAGERGTVDSRSAPAVDRGGNDAGETGLRSRSDTADADAQQPVQGSRGNRDESGGRGNREPGKPKSSVSNYRIQPGELTREGSWRATAERNVGIVELVKQITAENRQATPEEKAQLAKFTGWGASEIANSIFPDRYGRYKDATWQALGERLKAALTPEEYAQARRTTQYAHYTSEGVIRSIYSALNRLGFAGGTMVEPGMGVGHFVGLMPDNIAANSHYTGIEYDPVTGNIAKLLYPASNIQIGDYTRTNLPKDFFDAAIGNPPFSQTQVMNDPEYKNRRPMLHDYFFMKTIDRVKPGGLLVFVTSKGTMDKSSDKSRKYLAERANLLGAVRLPQTAFKDNAGTEVVTDVIFLQKKGDGIPDNGVSWLGTKEVTTPQGPAAINEYFADHPDMVLGSHALTGSMYRANEYTVLPREGDIEQHFANALKNLPENVTRPVQGSLAERALVQERDFNPKHRKEGGLYLDDNGRLMQVEDGSGVEVTHRSGADGKPIALAPKQKAWLKGYVGVRDALKQAQYDQLNDGDWETSLKALNDAYDGFVAQHGPILDYTTIERTNPETGETTETKRYKNEPLLRLDTEGALAYALENVKEDGSIVKGAALTGRVLQRPSEPEIKTTNDALFVSLNRNGALSLDDVAALAGTDRDSVIRDLGTAIYEAPGKGWQLADEYLSGNVVRKLKEAQAAAEINPKFKRNVDALLAVQPRPLGPTEITVRLGANWVPASDIQSFGKDVLGVEADIVYNPVLGTWNVDTRRADVSEFGFDKMNAGQILDSVLNARQLKVTYRDSEGGTHTDIEATEKANDIAGKMRERFKTWLWTDATRADRLTKFYNENFNNIAPRQFDGSHLTLPGVSSRFNLYPHQKRAVWRVIQQGDVYLAHAVGAGKTMEMIASGMEERRLGLVKKPMYVVPNHMLAQFSREFLELYPAASIMVADENNFHTHNRKRFVAQAALNNPDAIVITHSAFGRIAMSDEFSKSFIQDQIDAWQEALDDAKGDRITTKQIERRIEQLERRLEGKQGKEKKDKVLDFEELGVDKLYVDEFHEFRKLDFATNQGNVKGVDPNGSQRALDMMMKVQYLRQKNPGRSLVAASGTPVTNTMGELYTAQRFFQPEQLKEDGLDSFDAWSAQYGDIVTGFEQNAAGGYEMVSRFAKFQNVPELMRRVRSFMDILTSSNLGALVKRPDVIGGGREVIVTPVPEGYKEYQQDLQRRIQSIKNRRGPPKKGEDIILNVIGDGRFSAIDMRFVDQSRPSDPHSKLNLWIDDIIKAYKDTADYEYVDRLTGKTEPIKGASIIGFSDIGLGEASAANRGFDMRGWIEQRMQEAGIPAEHVAFMRDYKQHAKKERLFADMREGKKRILIGGKEMETGTNVQKRLTHLFHLDAPWFPASVEQREGRIVRQGNQNREVKINAYATKGSYDSTMWGMNARKARFIEQAMNGDDSVRSLDDVSEASAFEMAAALASGDQRYMELAGLKSDVEKLERLRHAHYDDQNSLRRQKHWEQGAIDRAQSRAAEMKEAIARREPIRAGEFAAKLGKQSFDSREAFSNAAFETFKALAEQNVVDSRTIGTIGGFDIQFHGAEMKGSGDYVASLNIDLPGDPDPLVVFPIDPNTAVSGIATRAANQVNGLDRELAKEQTRIDEAKRKIEQIGKRLGAPFPEEALLMEKVAALNALQEELAAESKEANADAAAATVQTEGKASEEPGDEAQSYSVNLGRDPAELEAIFDGLEARGLSRQRALQTLNSDPDAAIIRYINDNFFTILGELDDSGKVVIKC